MLLPALTLLAGCVETTPLIVTLRDPQTHQAVSGIPLQLYVRRAKFQSSADFWAERRTTGPDGAARFERAEVADSLWLSAWLPPDDRRVFIAWVAHPRAAAAPGQEPLTVTLPDGRTWRPIDDWPVRQTGDPGWTLRMCAPGVRVSAIDTEPGQERIWFPYEIRIEEPPGRHPDAAPAAAPESNR